MLFLITFVTSIPALVLYQPVLDDPVGYIASAGQNNRILFGAFLELLLIIANIGTAVVIFPIVRRQSEELALGYVTARLFECTFILVGIVAVLGIVTLQQEVAGAAEASVGGADAGGTLPGPCDDSGGSLGAVARHLLHGVGLQAGVPDPSTRCSRASPGRDARRNTRLRRAIVAHSEGGGTWSPPSTLLTSTRGAGGSSSVAVQLARRFSASSDFEPTSAVKTNMVSSGSALSVIPS